MQSSAGRKVYTEKLRQGFVLSEVDQGGRSMTGRPVGHERSAAKEQVFGEWRSSGLSARSIEAFLSLVRVFPTHWIACGHSPRLHGLGPGQWRLMQESRSCVRRLPNANSRRPKVSVAWME